MRELGIDIETYSSEDLKKCGVYRYVEAPDFAVLLFAYSWDGAPAVCVDLAQGEALPADVSAALTDPEVLKTAYNAAFERVCLSKWLGVELDVRQWRCTMVRALRMGLPASLGQCAEVLGLAEGKMAEGAALIRLFSKPAPRTGKRVMPADRPDKWETFKLYNARDVDVEQAVLRKVRRLEVPEFDEELWEADQRINDRGVLIDPVLVANAERFDQTYKARLLDEAKELTGLENPNSVTQLKAWLHQVTGVKVETINKTDIEDLADRLKHFRKASRMLAKEWDGKEQVNGGYIVVMDDGDVICYHSSDRESFRDYLYRNTHFEYVSADKYIWSRITKIDGEYYLPLNLSVRFNTHTR